MLFSATFPKDARKLAKTLLSNNHIRVRVGRMGSTHLNIQQNVRLNEPLVLHIITNIILDSLC